jgi:hypothetical protein
MAPAETVAWRGPTWATFEPGPRPQAADLVVRIWRSLTLRTSPGQQKTGRRPFCASVKWSGVVEHTALMLARVLVFCGSARRTVCEV